MNRRLTLLAALAAVALSSCGFSDARQQALAEAAVQPLTLENNWLPGLVGYADYPAQGWGPVGYPGVSGGSSNIDPVQNFLEGLGLLDEELPSGFSVSLLADGDTLKTETLSFCGGAYPSEKLRVSRRQMEATAANSPFFFLSSELVQYLNADDARQALTELVSQKKQCPNGTSFTDVTGQKQTIEFHAAPGPSSTVLLPVGDRAILHFTEKSNDGVFTYFMAVQIRGNTLSALYGVKSGASELTQSELDFMYGLLSGMSTRLMNAAASDIGL